MGRHRFFRGAGKHSSGQSLPTRRKHREPPTLRPDDYGKRFGIGSIGSDGEARPAPLGKLPALGNTPMHMNRRGPEGANFIPLALEWRVKVSAMERPVSFRLVTRDARTEDTRPTARRAPRPTTAQRGVPVAHVRRYVDEPEPAPVSHASVGGAAGRNGHPSVA
ncbi:hypothetical protein SRIMM317S_02487 [Streptomyces rimosus subsp. rimosus]